MTNQKHMSLEDRNYIEQALNQNMSFKEIAKFLCKDPTTIAKEVKKHKIRKEPNTFNNESGNVCLEMFVLKDSFVKRKMFVGLIVLRNVLAVTSVISFVVTLKKRFALL